MHACRDAIKKSDAAEISRLTGRFYTVIPHTFCRQRPPLIDTDDKLRGKFEMCDVLSDIETAQVISLGIPCLHAPLHLVCCLLLQELHNFWLGSESSNLI
jgi:hypothetical protein